MRYLLSVILCWGVFTPIVSSQELRRDDLKRGLIFQSHDDNGLTLTRLESSVGLTLKAGESAHPQSNGGNRFTWTGHIQIITPGDYRFEMTLLGDAKVTIGDTVVAAGNIPGTEAKVIAPEAVTLKPGIVPFQVELKRLDTAVRLELYWEGPGFRKEIIPYFFFGHLPKARPDSFATDIHREHGRFLFEEMSCVKCHTAAESDKLAAGLAPRSGPNLTEIGSRVYAGWLDAWLADPIKVRPNTTMPKMFTDDAKGQAERYAVTSYLMTLGQPMKPFTMPTVLPKKERDSLIRGTRLYTTTGCATCHGTQVLTGTMPQSNNPDEDELEEANPLDSIYGVGTAKGAKTVYVLGGVGSKSTPDMIAKYLNNPLATNPHGRMPNMLVGGQDAADIALHLARITDEGISTKMPEMPDVDPMTLVDAKVVKAVANAPKEKQWQAVGQALMTSKGCVNCHTVEPAGKALPTNLTAPKLSEIQGEKARSGCVSDQVNLAKQPSYKLDAEQKQALQEFLTSGLKGAGTPSPVHAGRVSLKRFNCMNCHNRDGEGGIDLALADEMKKLENAENADDVQPPRLTGVGHKMRTSWLREVLVNAGRARPWMNLRMPQFGKENVEFLAEALPALEGTVTDDTVVKPEFTAEKIEAGRTMTGKSGHGCISCHDISGVVGGGTRGPDLATTNRRVRYNWFESWLHQPQRMAPGTRMPQVFIDGKSLLTTVYGGDADKQLEAMWAYYSLGPGLPLPLGLEPPKGLIISVRDKPEILRTFMPNAGAKSIAIGFPGGISTVFDANECRVPYAWSGNFLDASPVWNNRGGAPAKLLGQKFWSAPVGPTWALMTGSDLPDFVKLAADPAYGKLPPEGTTFKGTPLLQFQGYALDAKDVPVFRYAVGAPDASEKLLIAETIQPSKTSIANGLLRTFDCEVPTHQAAVLNLGSTAGKAWLWQDGQRVEITKTAVAAAGTKLVLPGTGNTATVYQVTGLPAGANWLFQTYGDQTQVMLLVPSKRTEQRLKLELSIWALPQADDKLIEELK